MKAIFFTSIVFLLIACGDSNVKNDPAIDTSIVADSVIKPIPPAASDTTGTVPDTTKTIPDATSKIYSNKRFRNVMVTKTGATSFTIKGEGQIFEASFNWIIEDGHNELQKGYATTAAGAPEWGKFEFTVNAIKKRPNSTLHLIMFEASAKDGSRQHTLPVLLY